MSFSRAKELGLSFTREALYQAVDLTNQALELDPNFTMALVWQGWNHDLLAWSGWCESAPKCWEQAIAYGQRALAIDASLDYAHALLGEVYIMYKRDYEAGIRELETAATLNPNSAKTQALLAQYLPNVGRSTEAVEAIKRAWRLNPFPDDWYLDAAGSAYHGVGQYEKAAAAWRECARRLPDYIWCPLELTFLYMKTGREEGARAQVKEVLRINPRFRLGDWTWVFQESDVAHLRKAGLPE